MKNDTEKESVTAAESALLNGAGSIHPGMMECGLTKRELFAAMAMQGLVDRYGTLPDKIVECAKASVECADALLLALEARS